MKGLNSDSLDGFTMGIAAGSFAIILGLMLQLMLQSGALLAQGTGTQTLGSRALSHPPDRLWIESLLRTGATGLALDVCNNRVALSAPGSNAHAQWQMLGTHAKTAEALERIDWNSPFDALDSIQSQLVLSQPSLQSSIASTSQVGPREPWVRWKKLWCLSLTHQRVLAAYLAVPGRKQHQEWLLQSIRMGLDELDSLEQIVLKMEPDKPLLTKAQREQIDKTLPNQISAAEILDLRGELELLRIDLFYQRSQCHPFGSDEQISAATQMLSSIDRAKTQLAANWVHRPLLSLAEAEAQLQLARHPAVEKNLDDLWRSLEDSTATEARSWRLSAASLAIRSARMTQRWELADAWFAKIGDWESTPELSLEHLAMRVDRQGDRPVSPDEILKLRKSIAERFGKYWEQRVDALLVRSPSFNSPKEIGSPTTMPSLELFRIQARQALAAKEFQQAIEKLQQAELAASKTGQTQEASEFAMQIAAVLELMKQPKASADEFYRAAISYPEAPKAAKAALMSAWMIRDAIPPLDSDSKANARAIYLQRLKDTALGWPQSEPAIQAIELMETQWLIAGDFIAMTDFWSDYLAKAPKGFHQAACRWLLVALIAQDDWLEGSVQDGPKWFKSMNRLQQAILEAAKDSQESAVDLAGTPESVVNWMEAHQKDRRWQTNAILWTPRVDSVDSLGQLAIVWDRCETAWQIGSVSPSTLEELLKHRKRISDLRPGATTYGTARLDRFLDLLKIQIQSQNDEQLKQELQKRIAKEPKSLWWVYRSARTLQNAQGLSDLSLGWYRQMAAGVKPGSEPWLEARARSIQILRDQGQTAQANELRDLVIASYPDLPKKWQTRIVGN